MTGPQPSLRQEASHRDPSTPPFMSRCLGSLLKPVLLLPDRLLPTAHLEYSLDVTIHHKDTKCPSSADIKGAAQLEGSLICS